MLLALAGALALSWALIAGLVMAVVLFDWVLLVVLAALLGGGLGVAALAGQRAAT
jgi:hypothetical protein